MFNLYGSGFAYQVEDDDDEPQGYVGSFGGGLGNNRGGQNPRGVGFGSKMANRSSSNVGMPGVPPVDPDSQVSTRTILYE